MQELDESRLWKYLELRQEFQRRAGDIDIASKQHLRIIERLAKFLAKQKPKNPEDFERAEYLKDFCIKSAQLNEQTVGLIEYIRDKLNAIYADYEAFREGARLNRIIRDQDERLKLITKERDDLENELNELKRITRRAPAANI